MTGGSDPAPLPKLPPAYRLVALETTDSTNEEAKRLADQGAEDGTLVWAKSQTAGRGRRERSWVSPPGNLYFSVVTRPDCPVQRAAELSFVSALALGDAIGSVAPPMCEVTYKWPNDLLFNGRKGAGILLELALKPDGAEKGQLDWLVVGIGVNVTSYPEDTAFPATSLRFEGATAEVTDAAVLEAFARHLMAWVDRWLEGGFGPVRRVWLSHAAGLGEEIEVRLPKETLSGTFKDLDEEGGLLLGLTDGSERRITAGDVFF